MQWLQDVWLNPPLLLLVVLLSTILPLPLAYHPLTLYRYLAFALGKKVNPDPSRPRQQLYISGMLATLVATLPIIALCYSLYHFSQLPQLFDALLLFACIDWQQRRKAAWQIQQALQRNQLSLAREQASTLLLRRTDNLSNMGLSKAVCESLLLRSATEVVATLLWFLAAGGLAALGYRLLVVLQQQWNIKQVSYRYFGQPVARLVQLLSAPAIVVCCAVIALNYGVRQCWQSCSAKPLHIGRLPHWLLCCSAAALRRSLGGPVYYGSIKTQRSRITQQQEPTATDIAKILKLTRQNHLALVMLASVILLLQVVWLVSY
ncbi:cobalamin biosynthesis protein CobD/CbiB [Rheinheimera gaetbuli]